MYDTVSSSVGLAAQWSGVSVWLDSKREEGRGKARTQCSLPSYVLTNPSLPAYSQPHNYSYNYATLRNHMIC